MGTTGILGLIITATFLAASIANAAVAVRPASTAAKPEAYERLEWTVQLDREYANPFDPEEIAVDATFTGPGGVQLVVPGFWTQDFRRQAENGGRERLVAEGPAGWRIRFCPPAPGQWTMSVAAGDSAGVAMSEPMKFSVGPSQRPGFVRRAPGNARYFQFDNGQPYFIIGPNICWAGRGGLASYESWFSHLAQAGGNFARIWMAAPNRPTETKKAGLGRYDLEACALYEQALELADRSNIRIMLALGSYGDYREGGHFGEGQWPINVYNAANGGPAATPSDFFTHPLARKLYQRRLRYLIGRYGSYTSLAFWEFWNEQDNSPGVKIPLDWTREMAAYLKAHDPYHRLVTTSFAGTPDKATWDLPDIDLSQRHIYGDHESPASMYDREPAIVSALRAADGHRKPHLIGEIGICWRDDDGRHDPARTGTNLHNALWASALSGGAGGSCNWWWDSYIAPHNLWDRYTGLAKFAATVDWPRRQFEPIALASPILPQSEPETFDDLTVTAGSAWGKSHGKEIVLGRDGTASLGIPGFLYGPAKNEFRSPTTFKVDLPQASRMSIHLLKVSDWAMVRASVDGKPVADFALSALPGSPDVESTKVVGEHGVHQAILNKDKSFDVPAGIHTIALEVVGGDWVSIGSVTLTHARSSRYTGLRVMALSDLKTGETIAWLHDPASHCGIDAERKPLRTFEHAMLTLPLKGSFQVEWWDTRKGEIFAKAAAKSQGSELILEVPTFSRDLAVALRPAR